MIERHIMEIIDTVPNAKDRISLQTYFDATQQQLYALIGDRDWLRGQVSLALRSMKFDLHPELP